jgi:hypothetical protein
MDKVQTMIKLFDSYERANIESIIYIHLNKVAFNIVKVGKNNKSKDGDVAITWKQLKNINEPISELQN